MLWQIWYIIDNQHHSSCLVMEKSGQYARWLFEHHPLTKDFRIYWIAPREEP